MIQNSFVYLRTAKNQRKTLSFSISIPAVALGTCAPREKKDILKAVGIRVKSLSPLPDQHFRQNFSFIEGRGRMIGYIEDVALTSVEDIHATWAEPWSH